MTASANIDPSARKPHLAEDFDRVARGYDRLCTLNPGYTRHLRKSAQRLGLPRDGQHRILDLCCGTGLSTAALRRTYPNSSLTGLDSSDGMLTIAREKADLGNVNWLLGNAMDPAAAGAAGPYDAILMAYGIRNVTDPDVCLTQLRQLLAPGGVICLHEYSVADSRLSQLVWKGVANTIIIPLGKLGTGTTTIFRYLRESVLEFDGRRRLEQRLQEAGYDGVHTEPMDGWQRGIVHSFLASRPR